MNIYVANLSNEITEDDLRGAFKPFGQVTSASIIKDKYTGNTRGFAFVEMSSDQEGKAAIDALNGKELKGKTLTVNEAKPKENRSSRRGGHHGYGGKGYGGNAAPGGNRSGFAGGKKSSFPGGKGGGSRRGG